VDDTDNKEPEKPETDEKSEVVDHQQLVDFTTKLMLRVFNSCPLLAGYLEKQWVGKDRIELVFHDIPQSVRVRLPAIFGGCPFEEVEFYDGSSKMFGYRLKPTVDDVSDMEKTPEACNNEDPAHLCPKSKEEPQEQIADR
jgi:hypothetical protein